MVSIPYLPQNIMGNIFHKLPYESIARSKLVCKEWNSLISSPKFMDDYYNYHRLAEGTHLIIMDCSLLKLNGNSRFYGASYSNLLKEQSPLSSMKLSVKGPREWSEPQIWGSYNGMVAFSSDNQLILWNPLTRKHSSIRSNMRDPRDGESRTLHGLCYDGERDEYKVVRWSNYQSPPGSFLNFDGDITYEVTFVSIYNFKDADMRRLPMNDSFQMRLIQGWLECRHVGKVVCGMPHWVIKYYDFKDPIEKEAMLYFDFKDETFKHMAKPDESYGDYRIEGCSGWRLLMMKTNLVVFFIIQLKRH